MMNRQKQHSAGDVQKLTISISCMNCISVHETRYSTEIPNNEQIKPGQKVL